MIIQRSPSNDRQTLGTMTIVDADQKVFSCKTLELPWLNNATQKSCIPKGAYKVKKRTSPKYGLHFHIQNVPGRSWILIHSGNTHKDILGCILVGDAHRDINGDGYPDVVNSRKTLNHLLSIMPDEFELGIL